MEAVIDYEYSTGARGEEVPNEIAVVSENSFESFRFYSLLNESPFFPHVRSIVGRWDYSLLIIGSDLDRGHGQLPASVLKRRC
jgi:hypothetical protein